MIMMINHHAYDDDDEMGDLDTFDFDAPGIRCLVQSTLWGAFYHWLLELTYDYDDDDFDDDYDDDHGDDNYHYLRVLKRP